MRAAQVNNRKRAEQAFDLNVRVLGIVDMASATATEAFGEKRLRGSLEDFVDYLLDTGVSYHPSIEPLVKIFRLPEGADDGDGEPDRLYECSMLAGRRGLEGIALQVECPVRSHHSETAYSEGFGYTRTTWVYADTYEQAWEAAIAWVKESYAQDLEGYLQSAGQPEQ